MYKIIIECDVEPDLIDDMSKEAAKNNFDCLKEYLENKHLQDKRVESCKIAIIDTRFKTGVADGLQG
jgi:hypothetical protein